MFRTDDVPELAIVRVLTSGGPFAEGDEISVAFTNPTVGRMAAHRSGGAAGGAANAHGPILPETISVSVLRAAGPYGRDDVLTLSFVDPQFARIHGGVRRDQRPPVLATPAPTGPTVPAGRTEATQPSFESAHERVVPVPEPVAALRIAPPSAASQRPRSAVRFSLAWTEERVRRFVQVTDRLFTVDRLGWYRHAFAMRLLIPDEVVCGEAAADAEAARHLRVLRSAALEALGRPLIAAFMPTFSVTSEWLDTIDRPEAAKALTGLRATIAPFASRDQAEPPQADEPASTYGWASADELALAPASSVEALLPIFIPSVSIFDDVTERLTTYRQALCDLFGGTAQSAETVRCGQMAQPNHTLDDRLWQLVGTVGERFGGLAVA